MAVLGVFTGPGGMSQGIKGGRSRGLRFDVVVASDFNRAVEETCTANHPDTTFVSSSIEEAYTKLEIMPSVCRRTGDRGVGTGTGGPPCKGRSPEDKMTRNMDNPPNPLVPHYACMIRRTNPTAFIIENVPDLLGMQGGVVLNYPHAHTMAILAVPDAGGRSRQRR